MIKRQNQEERVYKDMFGQHLLLQDLQCWMNFLKKVLRRRNLDLILLITNDYLTHCVPKFQHGRRAEMRHLKCEVLAMFDFDYYL